MFPNDWQEILADELNEPYIAKLREDIKREYNTYTCYPPINKILNALTLTSYAETRVVIMGQDPYHQPGQAHGLAFSVPEGIAIPPSLQNIYKEIEQSTGYRNTSGNLEHWAKQGVLLLNSTLTVRAGMANSHAYMNWQRLTDRIILKLNEKKNPIIFLLWGSFAKQKGELITSPHITLTAPHPSPLSAYRGFLGCGHFAKTNELLASYGQKPIVWGVL